MAWGKESNHIPFFCETQKTSFVVSSYTHLSKAFLILRLSTPRTFAIPFFLLIINIDANIQTMFLATTIWDFVV
jgi:hypothetical protein